MIDLHSHILPKLDDGSRSSDESLNMLTLLADQGVDLVVATPHYYAFENSPERFLERREASYMRLKQRLGADKPKVLLGAEVMYFEGIGYVEDLDKLRIEGTNLLLIEMPFDKWTDRCMREVISIGQRPDITVVLAHVDRYLGYQPKKVWGELASAGIRMQMNADPFLKWNTRYTALKMIKQGIVNFIGSDCHNTASRAPRIGEAQRIISEKIDPEMFDRWQAWQYKHFTDI